MTPLETAALTIASGLIVGVVTAVVSVRLALRRFRAERTWERRVAAYSELFDALYHVRRYARTEITRLEEGQEYDKKYMKELGDKASAGYDSIRRAAVKGTFVVGNEAASRLKALEVAFDGADDGDMYDTLSTHFDVVNKAIEELRPIAARDLNLE